MLAFVRSMQTWSILKRLDIVITRPLPLEAWEAGTSGEISIPAAQRDNLTGNWMELDGEVYLLGSPGLPASGRCTVPVYAGIDAFALSVPASDVLGDGLFANEITFDAWNNLLQSYPDPLYRIPYLSQEDDIFGIYFNMPPSRTADQNFIVSIRNQIQYLRQGQNSVFEPCTILLKPTVSGITLSGFGLTDPQRGITEGKYGEVHSADIQDVQISKVSLVLMPDPEVYSAPFAVFEYCLMDDGSVMYMDSKYFDPARRVNFGQSVTIVRKAVKGDTYVIDPATQQPYPSSNSNSLAQQAIADGAPDCNITFSSTERYHVGPIALSFLQSGFVLQTAVRSVLLRPDGRYQYQCGGLVTTLQQRLTASTFSLGPFVRHYPTESQASSFR